MVSTAMTTACATISSEDSGSTPFSISRWPSARAMSTSRCAKARAAAKFSVLHPSLKTLLAWVRSSPGARIKIPTGALVRRPPHSSQIKTLHSTHSSCITHTCARRMPALSSYSASTCIRRQWRISADCARSGGLSGRQSPAGVSRLGRRIRPRDSCFLPVGGLWPSRPCCGGRA
jgi:hypothetical protein